MTSHLISYMARRAEANPHLEAPAVRLQPSQSEASGREQAFNGAREKRGEPVEGCTFCEILRKEQPAHIVYEDEHVLAFLDILPIRPGHLLVIPKAHYARVSHLPDEVSAAIGRALPRIARALCRAVDQPDFNIVSNQGYAQIVHHVHYHLVPAPTTHATSYASRSGWASVLGRDELDDDEAAELVVKIKEELEKEAAQRSSKL